MADRKPKAGSVPPRKASPDKSGEAEIPQRERFIEAAKAAGVTDETFDKAMGKIAPAKRRKPK